MGNDVQSIVECADACFGSGVRIVIDLADLNTVECARLRVIKHNLVIVTRDARRTGGSNTDLQEPAISMVEVNSIASYRHYVVVERSIRSNQDSTRLIL